MMNLRGAVSRDLYCRNAEYDQMPMLLTFKFTQWLRKEHRTVKVIFDYDGKEEDLDLHYVFAVGGRFEWRPGELDGRMPRRSALPRLESARGGHARGGVEGRARARGGETNGGYRLRGKRRDEAAAVVR